MEIEYTSRYLKDYGDIRDKRAKKDTDNVERKIREAQNFIELNKILDIKKYEIGGYRIRYSGKPEWRIRFELVPNPSDNKQQMIKLQLVLPREKYEKYAHKKLDESIVGKSLRIVINENQFEFLKKYLYNRNEY